MKAETLEGATAIAGPHLLLHHYGGYMNYGHWMMDCLIGAWVLAEDIREGRVRVITAPLKPWQRETLKALGVPAFGLTEVSSIARCDHLIVPSALGMGLFTRPSPLLIQCFRALRAGCPPPANPLPRCPRVYVARETREPRRIRNEADLIRALERRGFVAVLPGRLSIPQQVQLFAGAACVVGPYGSGLSNIAYMAPGRHVVDIVPDLFTSWLWLTRLSALLQLRYAMTVVDTDAEQDFEADVPAVLHALDVFGFR
jgi:capsular polysaccharide biosynthesis protein